MIDIAYGRAASTKHESGSYESRRFSPTLQRIVLIFAALLLRAFRCSLCIDCSSNDSVTSVQRNFKRVSC